MNDSANAPKALPKQELLLKLLKMTTSPNDGEALTAVRKANELLATAGWDWDKLIHAKITVVADPFASIPEPPRAEESWSRPRAPQPPPPSRASRGGAPMFASTGNSYSPPPPPRPAPPPPPPKPRVLGTKQNIYSGGCYCCGKSIAIGKGFMFNPNDWNSAAKNKWMPVCHICNSPPSRIAATPAKRSYAQVDLYDTNVPPPPLSNL